MERDCRCIRRRLIIICTKYFVIVNYGAATSFRGRDQAPLGETGKPRERFCVRLSQSRVQIRALSDHGGILRSFRSITIGQAFIHHFSFSYRRLSQNISHKSNTVSVYVFASLEKLSTCLKFFLLLQSNITDSNNLDV